MSNEVVQSTIISKFEEKRIFKNIDPEQDFFDLGASSLTIVDLQLQVEEALGFAVATSLLMANPTINGWVAAYVKELESDRIAEVVA